MMTSFCDEETDEYTKLKKLENILNNRTESFHNKVESLIEVWKQVSSCRLTEHKQYVVHLMDWLKLHTLNIVLTGDFKKTKDTYAKRLLTEVEYCESLLRHSNNIFSLRCRKLAEVIKDPWGNPVLHKLLTKPDCSIGVEEIEFFGMETGYLISTRLRKLCESHCEDMALNLVTSFMRCRQVAEEQQCNLNATEDQRRFILDVYIALLYKYKKTTLIVSTLKSLTLAEGLELLKRFAHKRVNISKIWRHSSCIAHLAAQVFVTKAIVQSPKESAEVLEGLLETWLFLNESNEDRNTLSTAVRRIIQETVSPKHMYIFCEAFYKKFGSCMKTFVIELYIRALTTDMNGIEEQKNEDDAEKVAEISERLAHGFLRLADVLNENLKISRECVLTSFSLKPTQSTLDRLVNLAKSSNYEVLDTGQQWKCKYHPPIDASDEVCFKCEKCDDFMSEVHVKSPLSTNIALSEAVAEQLDLSPQLRDDLVVVISSPRYQLFNWIVPWKDLHRLCVVYLNDPERTKNLVKELKFVDIDYSIFAGVKCEPEDEEINGIERGYEHYLEGLYPEPCSVSSDESPHEVALTNDAASENFRLRPPPVTKLAEKPVGSKPQLKPNLKRSNQDQEDSLPPKVFASSPSKTLMPHAFTQNALHGYLGQPRIQNPFLPSNTYATGFSKGNTLAAPSFLTVKKPRAFPPLNNHQYVQDRGFQKTFISTYAENPDNVRYPTVKDEALNLSVRDSSVKDSSVKDSSVKDSSVKDSSLIPMDLSKYSRSAKSWADLCGPVSPANKNCKATISPERKCLKEKTESTVKNNLKYSKRSTKNNKEKTPKNYKKKTPTNSLNSKKNYLQKFSKTKISQVSQLDTIAIQSNSGNLPKENSNESKEKNQTLINFPIDRPVTDSSESLETSTSNLVSYSKNIETNSSVNQIPMGDFYDLQKVGVTQDLNVAKTDHCSSLNLPEECPTISNLNFLNFPFPDANSPIDFYPWEDIIDSDILENFSGRTCTINFPYDPYVNEFNNECAVPSVSVDQLNPAISSTVEDSETLNSEVNVTATQKEPLRNPSPSKNMIPSASSGADDKENHCNTTSFLKDSLSSNGGAGVHPSSSITLNIEKSHLSSIESKDNQKDNCNSTCIVIDDSDSESDSPKWKGGGFLSQIPVAIEELETVSSSQDRNALSDHSKEDVTNITAKPTCLAVDGINSSSSCIAISDSDSNSVSYEWKEECDLSPAPLTNEQLEKVTLSPDMSSSEHSCKVTGNNYHDSNSVSCEWKEECNLSRVPLMNEQLEKVTLSPNMSSSEHSCKVTGNNYHNEATPPSVTKKTRNINILSNILIRRGVDSTSKCIAISDSVSTEFKAGCELSGAPLEKERLETVSPFVDGETLDEHNKSTIPDSNYHNTTIAVSKEIENVNTLAPLRNDKFVFPSTEKDESITESNGSEVVAVSKEIENVNTLAPLTNDEFVFPSTEEDETITESNGSEVVPSTSYQKAKEIDENVAELAVSKSPRNEKDTTNDSVSKTICYEDEKETETTDNGTPELPSVNDSISDLNFSDLPASEKVQDMTPTVSNEGDKSNDENTFPNWYDISLLQGFGNRIQNFDDDIVKIKGFTDKSRDHNFKNRKADNEANKRKNMPHPMSKRMQTKYNALAARSARQAAFSRRHSKEIIASQNIPTSITNVSSTSVKMSPKNKDGNMCHFLDLVQKYKLKEVRVVLNRLNGPEISDKKECVRYNEPNVNNHKSYSGPKKITITSENMSNKKSKGNAAIHKRKSDSKPWPLQDISPKANRFKNATNIFKKDKCSGNFKADINTMNPCVILKRLEIDKDKKRIATSVLAQVPGLNDLQMIRPSSVDRIVQVVQVPGTRSTANVPIQNTQTSTQITPHIQRIGQPRTEKPVSTDHEPTSTSTTMCTSSSTSTATTESPTLINFLSQELHRSPNPNNRATLKPKTSGTVNHMSSLVVREATSNAKVTSSGTTEQQVNNIPRVISGGDQIISQLINQVRAPAPTLKTLVSAPGSDQNRILQFICKSSDGKLIPVTSFTSNKVVKVSMTQTVNASVTGNFGSDENSKLAQNNFKTKSEAGESIDMLPKFQQAFGKPTYQNNVDSTESTGTNSETVNSDSGKSGNIKSQPKNSPASLNIQPVQGGVIYTRQVPVGQTINLIPPGRGQVFRIATSNAEQLSLVKDSVIQGKMSALLAAALQGKQRTLENNEIDINSEDDCQATTRVTLTSRPSLVQNARILKPVLQIPSNVIRSTPQSNLSSTTLEQLREFDMVYKQVKERSSTNTPTQSESNDSPQQISVTYLNQGQKLNCAPVVVVSSYCNVQPAASPSLSVTSQGSSSPCVSKTATKSPKAKTIKNTTTHTAKASPLPKPQQKPQEDEHTTQRIFDILAEYAEQLRNSPDLNNKPAPRRRSNPPTNPNQNTKRKKSSSSKKTGQSSNSLASDGDMDDTHTVGSEDSSCGVVQISVQDDEQPLATVNTSESSEASTSPKQLILTDSTPNQSHSLIIADSNVGEALKMTNTAVLVPGNYIMPVSMVKGGQQIAVVSGGSKILATVPSRSGPNMLLFQSFLNQTRKHGLPTVKYSAIQPISGITRNISGITTQSTTNAPVSTQNLTTVTLSPTVGIQKLNQFERVEVNNFDATEVFLAISQPQESKNAIECQQNDHLASAIPNVNTQIVRVDSDIKTESSYDEGKPLSNSSVATSVIAQTTNVKDEISQVQSSTAIMALNLNSSHSDKDTTVKVEGRVQSVLVATGTSNGPMLSHNPPTFKKQVHSINSIPESNKDEYLRSEGKQNTTEPNSLPSSSIVYSFQNKIRKTHMGSQRLDRELTLQRKQAALERELRLQKSLSEECEDLGVDEPSASDLFPEADLPFDNNHSPSFDQTSQDLVRRVPVVQEAKEETRAIGIFCDDEPMRTDFLFEPIEYQTASVDLGYERSRDVRNGQSQSGLCSEDNTLLRTCASMSDVTIPSPISPEPSADFSPLTPSKRKYIYTNKKKIERPKQPENWSTELSSSEDTTGSPEVANSASRSPEPFSDRHDQNLNCDEELYRFTIVERLPQKDDQECQEIDCEEVTECPSGRGARRSVKKTCSCCNGTVKVARKRSASRPPSPIKKTVTAKKR